MSDENESATGPAEASEGAGGYDGPPAGGGGAQAGPPLRSGPRITILGVYHLVATLILVVWVVNVWPPPSKADLASTTAAVRDAAQSQLLVLVILAGLLGSFVHASNSFATFVGNGAFRPSWTWWYLLRPAVAMPMALAVYLLVASGLFVVGNGEPMAILAVAFLAGMFGQKTADKFSDIMDVVLRTAADERRADKLVPLRISSVSPARVVATREPVPVTLVGTGFTQGVVVQVNGSPRRTTFVDATHLTFTLEPEDATAPGQHRVRVVGPTPAGEPSNEMAIEVVAGEPVAAS